MKFSAFFAVQVVFFFVSAANGADVPAGSATQQPRQFMKCTNFYNMTFNTLWAQFAGFAPSSASDVIYYPLEIGLFQFFPSDDNSTKAYDAAGIRFVAPLVGSQEKLDEVNKTALLNLTKTLVSLQLNVQKVDPVTGKSIKSYQKLTVIADPSGKSNTYEGNWLIADEGEAELNLPVSCSVY